MRVYKFNIYDYKSQELIKQFWGGISPETNAASVKGLNVAFEIQIFDKNTAMTPASIRLDNAYNLDSYLIDVPKLEQCVMEFYAYWLEMSPLIKRNQYTMKPLAPLIYAPITTIIPDFSGITKSVWFHYNPTAELNWGQTRAQIGQQNFRWAVTLHTGEKLIDALNSYVNSVWQNVDFVKILNTGTDGRPVFKAMDDGAAMAVWEGGDTIVSGRGIDGFFSSLGELTFKYNSDILRSRVKIIAGTNNVFWVQSTIVSATESVSLNDGSRQDNPLILEPQDFIVQPNLVSVSGELNAVVRLRTDIKIGSYIKISNAKISTSGIAGQVGTGIAMQYPAYYAGALYSGNIYQVTAINYMGEYYDPSPNSWTSQLSMIPIGQANAESALKRMREG